MINADIIVNNAIRGILETFIMITISGIIIYYGYEKEWHIVEQISAISLVIFTTKVVLFTLPYMVKSLRGIF